jgi:hypothetical protein
MLLRHENLPRPASVALAVALVLSTAPCLLHAQAPAPSAPANTSPDFPKTELFLGYQWLNPGGDVPDLNSPPDSVRLPSMAKGLGGSVAYNFTKWGALEGNYGLNWNHGTVNTATIGPKFTWRGEGVNFYLHTLIGAERLSGRCRAAWRWYGSHSMETAFVARFRSRFPVGA